MESGVFLVFLCLLGRSLSTKQQYSIVRHSTLFNLTGRPAGADWWRGSIDEFRIPSLLCESHGQRCSSMGGESLTQDECHCVCSRAKSTFGLYTGVWKCTENSVVRQHAGCFYRIEKWTTVNSPLYTLPVQGKSDESWVSNLPKETRSCRVVKENSTYLKCDGTWGKLDEKMVNQKLFLQMNDKDIHIGPYKIHSLPNPLMNGRVIRLAIKCENITWNPTQCVALKLMGQLNCSSPIPSVAQRDIPQLQERPITEELLIVQSSALPPTNRTSFATTTPYSGDGGKRGQQSTTPYSGDVGLAGKQTSASYIGDGGQQSASKNEVAVIGGSVGGGVALLIVILVLALLVCVRGKRKLIRSQDNESVFLSQSNGTELPMAQINKGVGITRDLPLSSALRPLPETPKDTLDGRHGASRDTTRALDLYNINPTDMVIIEPKPRNASLIGITEKRGRADSRLEAEADGKSDGDASYYSFNEYDIVEGEFPFPEEDEGYHGVKPWDYQLPGGIYTEHEYDVVGSQIPFSPSDLNTM